VIFSSLSAILSTTSPAGIKDDNRNLLAMLLILPTKSAATEHRKSSNVSQSPYSTPKYTSALCALPAAVLQADRITQSASSLRAAISGAER
jgi:hypothetical protein